MNDRNSYDIGASEEVQTRVKQLSGQINNLIGQHERSVQALLSDADATNVTDEYRGIESKFGNGRRGCPGHHQAAHRHDAGQRPHGGRGAEEGPFRRRQHPALIVSDWDIDPAGVSQVLQATYDKSLEAGDAGRQLRQLSAGRGR